MVSYTDDSQMLLTATPMMRQYLEVKLKHKDCLLFYRLGDFFELFFEDAVIVSKELGLTLTKRGKQDGEDIPMCGVPIHAYELYLSKLIQKGYKVAICDQTESPEEAKERGQKGPLNRQVVRIVTSGTLTEDELLPSGHNYILTLSLPARSTLSCAISDVSTGDFFVETFSISELNNILEKWNPVEIVLADELFAGYTSIFSPIEKKLSLLPKARFDRVNAQRVLEETYDVATLDVFWPMKETEVQAAGVLIDYIRSVQCQKNIQFRAPKCLCCSDFMQIDASTRRNLDLFVTDSHQGETLFSVLNKTQTGAGKRLLQNWLSMPLLNPQPIEERLDWTDFFLKQAIMRKQIQSIFHRLPDLERILTRLSLHRASPKDLQALSLILSRAVCLGVLLDNEPVKDQWKKNLNTHNDLQSILEKALQDEVPTRLGSGDFIRDEFDETLQHYRQLRDHASDEIARLQGIYAQQTGICNLRIKRNNIWGFYIEVSSGQIKKIPYDFIHRQTLTNCTRYTHADLIQLEKSINEAEHGTLQRELELFESLCQSALAQRESLLSLAETLAEIDVLTAMAELAERNHYVRPQIVTEPILEIKDGRHPVVEQAIQRHHDQKNANIFVENDCVMEKDKRKFLLLTGPNMAGKSTYLRQNALIIIMAQSGFFVPATSAKIGVVDQIFSRIGASDDLASGRSTFMVEMIETATILHQATSRSFVILDEVGRGTATFDGVSIAWAVCEYLCQTIQCRTLFATHYHELSGLVRKFSMMTPITATIQEWEGKIIFLHKIVDGIAKNSYGIHVAQLAGLPKSVIIRAAEILQNLEKHQSSPLLKPGRGEPERNEPESTFQKTSFFDDK